MEIASSDKENGLATLLDIEGSLTVRPACHSERRSAPVKITPPLHRKSIRRNRQSTGPSATIMIFTDG